MKKIHLSFLREWSQTENFLQCIPDCWDRHCEHVIHGFMSLLSHQKHRCLTTMSKLLTGMNHLTLGEEKTLHSAWLCNVHLNGGLNSPPGKQKKKHGSCFVEKIWNFSLIVNGQLFYHCCHLLFNNVNSRNEDMTMSNLPAIKKKRWYYSEPSQKQSLGKQFYFPAFFIHSKMFKNIFSHRHWNKYYTSCRSAPVLFQTNDIQEKTPNTE